MEAGHNVVGVFQPGEMNGNPCIEMVEADIVSGKLEGDALAGAEAVIHLAARNHTAKESATNPLAEYRKVNVSGTANVVRAALHAGVHLFFHFSSVKAMGERAGEILDEESPCLPGTPYGISKMESEDVVRVEAGGAGMSVVVFRLPMVYGPGNKGNFPRMIRWAERGLPFPLVQPDNLRSMVYVGNVVAAVVAVLDSLCPGKAMQETYIVKDETDCSTRMIFSSICRELGKATRFIVLPAPLGRIASVISEDFRKVTSSFRVSSAKIRGEIGFVPPVSWEEGIVRTVRWYKRSAR